MARVDRRVGRTRAALHQALISLLEERPYEEISVGAICERADVGRSAFYQHFKGKDDLFRLGFARLRVDLLACAQAGMAGREASLEGIAGALFAHAERHGRLYRVLAAGHAGSITARRMREILSEVLDEIGAYASTGDPLRRALLLEIGVSGLLGVLRWWFDHGCRPDKDEVAAAAAIILMRGAAAIADA